MKKGIRKVAPIFLALLIVLSILSSIAISQDTPTATEEDLNLDIAPKTFKEPKMESVIEQIVNVRESKPAEVQRFATAHEISIEDERIRVVLELTDEKAFLEGGYDIEIEATYKNLVQALVPISAIEALAKDTTVQYIRLPLRAYPMITSEGVGVIGADELHAKGIKGDNVKIAVIDLGFLGYNTTSEIPLANIKENISFRADGDIEAGESHGTACTEVVVDVAPNASLYLYNFNTGVEFWNAVDHAIEQGVDIISCSIGWFYGPFDGTGLICDIANNASTNGILFVNSAGNSAQRHWEGAYDEGTITVGGETWYVHKFAPGNVTNSFYAYADKYITVTLSWNDWPESNQDFDLYLVYGDIMTIVSGSANPQTGTQSPYESFTYEVPSSGWYGILIREYSATDIVDFEVYSFYHNFEYKVEESSITIPADAEGVMAVGATYWGDDSLESFSSQGPTNDGRTKPDVTAPDGVSNSVYGKFYGTSASAPHTAGAAALLLNAKSSLTADQLQSCLESTAVDLGAPGKDNLFGSGRIDVLAAYNECAGDFIADHVVISEIQTDSTEGSGGSYDDFIELYNPTSEDIDMATAGYRLERWTGGGTHTIVVRFGDVEDGTYPGGTTIPAHGFYLVVDDDATDASLKAKADALVTKTFALSDDYAVGLGTGPMDGPTDEDTVDFVGWGTPYDDLYEGSGAASNPPEGESLQRKVNATINYQYPYGPAWDSDDNSADFFIQDSPNPTNSTISSADPMPPIPELSTLILFSTGLITLAGYVLLTRRRK